jgi:DNA-binding IclR family transcriptional regulator
MKANQTHQSLQRGLRMIEAIATIGSPPTLAEIARKTELPVSTVHHLLHALVEFGYLVKDENQLTYTLSPKLYRLTENSFTNDQLAEIAKPFLEKLSHLTGEGTSIGVIRDGAVTIIAKFESEGPLRVIQEVGGTIPIYCTAVGKLLAAWLPKKELDRIISQTNFERKTTATITSSSDFRRELAYIRETGFAIDNEEHIKGICCIATSVRDHSGEVRAALCVVGPKVSFYNKKLKKIQQNLNGVTTGLSVRLGYELSDDRP